MATLLWLNFFGSRMCCAPNSWYDKTIELCRYLYHLRPLRHGRLSGESIPFLGADNGATSHDDKQTDGRVLLLNLACKIVLNTTESPQLGMKVRVGDEVLMRYGRSRASKKRIFKKDYPFPSSWFHQLPSENCCIQKGFGELLLVKTGDEVHRWVLLAVSSITYKEVVDRQRRQYPTASTSTPSPVFPWLSCPTQKSALFINPCTISHKPSCSPK